MPTFDVRAGTSDRGGDAARADEAETHVGPAMQRLLGLLSDPQPSAHEIAKHLDAAGGREWNEMVQLLQRRMGNTFTDQVIQQTQQFQRHKTPDGWK
jgi:hypothetical protein